MPWLGGDMYYLYSQLKYLITRPHSTTGRQKYNLIMCLEGGESEQISVKWQPCSAATTLFEMGRTNIILQILQKRIVRLKEETVNCCSVAKSNSVSRWTAGRQASLFFTISPSLLKLMSIVSVMPSDRLILSPQSPPALNLSQHQGFFQWVGSSPQGAKVLELQLQPSVLLMNIQG